MSGAAAQAAWHNESSSSVSRVLRSDAQRGAPLYVVRADVRSTSEIEDAELARALVAGAPGAPAQAWERFAPMVFRAVQRALGPGEDAHDVTQEIFLRLFRRVHTLEDPAALRSFVYSITTRVIRSELRSRWVRRVMRLSDTGRLPEPAVATSDDDGREALQRLYAILDRLRARDRMAFVLRNFEGLSLEELATALDVSLATVKRVLARAGGVVERAMTKDPVLARYLATHPLPREEAE